MSPNDRIDGINPYPGPRQWDEEERRRREEQALRRRRERKQPVPGSGPRKPADGEPGGVVDDYA